MTCRPTVYAIVGVALAANALAWGRPVHAAEVERCALWVLRASMATSATIDSAIARAEQIGCTDLFVQVRGRGDAMYRSDFVPRATVLRRTDFDPLAYAIARGHERHMRVHAWVNTFFLWSGDTLPSSRDHLWLTHPEWLDVDRMGRPMAVMEQDAREDIGAEGAYIAPACVEARAYLVRVFTEIAQRYAVDGIHLDYVRYASDEMGFSPSARDTFLHRFGMDPVRIIEPRDPLFAEWHAWRAEQVNALVRDTRAALDSVRAGITLSAAVFANPDDAYQHRGQDWPRWLREGWIDFAAPMCYGERWMSVDKQIRRSRQAAGPRATLYVGLATYNQTAPDFAMRAVLARSTGAQGIAVYSYDAIAHDAAYWRYLARNVFRAPTAAGESTTLRTP